MLKRFREFRWTRPFWGGLLLFISGFVLAIGVMPPLTSIVRFGIDVRHMAVGLVCGIVLGVLMMFMGFVAWFIPKNKNTAGIIAVILGLISFPLVNIGGWVVGMLFGVLGGCWIFGWTRPKKYENGDYEPVEPTSPKVPA